MIKERDPLSEHDQAALKAEPHARPPETTVPAMRPANLLTLQRTAGNRAVSRLLRAAPASELGVSPADDASEREADQVAERLMQPPDPISRHSGGGAPGRGDDCPGCGDRPPTVHRQAAAAGGPLVAPPVVRAALRQPGRPLDPGMRRFMERRMGYDLGDVRLHTNTLAADSARAVDARAYTVGQDIVFGAGEHAPHTSGGRRLLAHELAHVVQQGTGTTGPAIRRKPAPKKPTVWYQEVLDALAGHAHDWVDLGASYLTKVKNLAEAVEAKDQKAIVAAVDILVAQDPPNLAPYVGYESTFREIIARLVIMGLSAPAEKLTAWYLWRKKEEAGPYQPRDRAYSEHFYLWETVVEKAVAQVPGKGAEAADKAMTGLIRVVQALRTTQQALDPKELKKDRERQRSLAAVADPFSWMISHTISTFYGHLTGLIVQAFVAFQRAYQVLLEEGIANLEAGRPTTLLTTARTRLGEMGQALGDLDKILKQLAKTPGRAGELLRLWSRDVEITKSESKKGGGRYLDYFLAGKQARRRSVGFEYYDRDTGDLAPSEKTFSVERILLIRRNQLSLLERLYGQERDKKGALTVEAKENQALIAGALGGKMRLHSNDDWRQFLWNKFQAQEKKVGRSQALLNTVEFLQTYLRAFTTHSPHNIEDFGDNHLTRTFPRALTGQLLHDCGVYALRIAYMLSLLREPLKLTFQYVRLPLHVGLVITGDGLPAFVAHNDTLEPFLPDRIKELQTEWRGKTDLGEPRTPPAPLDAKQFWGEVAAREFVPNVDMPFKVLDVPATAGQPAAVKARLWQDYVGRVAKQDVFGPKVSEPGSEAYQFDLRYLEVLEYNKQLHNKYYVPFWNSRAPAIWKKHAPVIQAALKRWQGAGAKEKKQAAAAYQAAVDTYLAELTKAFAPANEAIIKGMNLEAKLNVDLMTHPEVVARGARVSPAARLALPNWISQELLQHSIELRKGGQIVPPFVDKKNLIWPVG